MSRADAWKPDELAVLDAAHEEGLTGAEAVAWVAERLPARTPPRKPRAISYMLGATAPNARPRGRALGLRISKRALREGATGDGAPLTAEELAATPRPVTREDCRVGAPGAIRPCPWVSCKHTLYLDVNERGSIKVNWPHLEPHQVRHSCALDVAESGGVSLEEAGEMLNLTRERMRQLEQSALNNLVTAAARSLAWGERSVSAALRELMRDGIDASHLEAYRRATAPRESSEPCRYLPVVRTETAATTTERATPRAALPDELSPRTWLRRASARRAP